MFHCVYSADLDDEDLDDAQTTLLVYYFRFISDKISL